MFVVVAVIAVVLLLFDLEDSVSTPYYLVKKSHIIPDGFWGMPLSAAAVMTSCLCILDCARSLDDTRSYKYQLPHKVQFVNHHTVLLRHKLLLAEANQGTGVGV